MPAVAKLESSRTHPRESSFVTLLSGWMQQGVDSFFATQRILLDLAMRQNASVMHLLRERLTSPHHSPASILTELAGEGMSNFIEAQEVLLKLVQQQNDIVMGGVKQRLGDSATAGAMTDLLRRSIDTFIGMQHDFLKIATKQTHAWLEAAKSGRPYKGDEMVDLAREGMENFVHAQKKFLDVISEEIARATSGKHTNGMKKIKKTELAELARQATESFIEAQKRLFDLAGKQMTTNVKAAGRAMEIIRPMPFVGLADLTREGVKSYVEAQKALMEVMLKPGKEQRHVTVRPARRHPPRGAKSEVHTAKAAAV